ncbi:MAG: Ig-like domain-containing protein [Gallionella sp.]
MRLLSMLYQINRYGSYLIAFSSLFITGCGGSRLDVTCSPSPQFNSTPPTTATVGQQYNYVVHAVHECGLLPFTCANFYVVQAPSGTSDGSPQNIAWIPSADQVDHDVHFAIATVPDYCGNSTTQSWNVRVLPYIAPLTVHAVSPANSDVPVNSIISVSFSQPVNSQTVTTASFLVSGPSGNITGNVQTSGSQVTFTPSADLPHDSLLTATITTVVQDLVGTALTSNYSWTFSTSAAPDITPPTVPDGLSATRTTGSEIEFSWISSTDNSGIAGYQVYRDGAYMKSVTNLALLSSWEGGLDFNTQYCYTVSASDYSGNESAQSIPLCVTTLDFASGSVATWGGSRSHSDGTISSISSPDVIANIDSVSAITLGSQAFAVKSDDTVWQLDLLPPTQVSGLGNVLTVSAGENHSLAVKSDGTVWVWNSNYYGQFGNGTTQDSLVPVQMLAVGQVVAVAAGIAHSLALQPDGSVWASGGNWLGQLGDGTTISKDLPVQVPSLSNIVEISAYRNQSLALKSDGTIWAWGDNGFGSYRSTPSQVIGISNGISIAQGHGFALAVKADGTVWGWGINTSGQLGDGTTTSRTTPAQVTGLTNVIAVAAGDAHSMALRSDGTVWAWGNNSSGELGDGTTISETIPVQVLGISQAKAIAAGGHGSMALR